MAAGTTFEAATPAEPFSCALPGVNQANARPDDKTLLIGAGAMGLIYFHGLTLKGVRGTIADTSADRRASPHGRASGDLMRDADERFASRRALRAPEFWLLVTAALAAAGSVPWSIVVPLTPAGLSIASLPKYAAL